MGRLTGNVICRAKSMPLYCFCGIMENHVMKEGLTLEYRFRELLRNKIMSAVLSIALGIVIIIARRAALDLLVKIIGGLILAGGVAFAAIDLIRPETATNLKMDLTVSGLAVLAGIILITCAEGIVDFFPTMMGVFLILNGLSHLAVAGTDSENRILAGILGVAIIILGLLIIMRPGFIADAIMVFIGASFVVNGIFDLVMVKRVS